MAVSGAILVDASGSSAICDVNPRAESHFREAFARIDGMRRTGSLLCDVTVVFGNGHHIKAHKLILASSSKFFRTLFVDPTLGFSSVIKVQDSSEEVGQLLIEFAYTAHLDINEANVIEILHGAEKLGFEQVEYLCVEALRTKLDLNRVHGMDLPSLINLVNRFGQQDTLQHQQLQQQQQQTLLPDPLNVHPDNSQKPDQGEAIIQRPLPHFNLPECLPIVSIPEEDATHLQQLQQQQQQAHSEADQNRINEAGQQELDLTIQHKLQQSDPPQTTHVEQPIPNLAQIPTPQERLSHQSQQQHQQQHPVYVELTPGHIVLMTSSGQIRKIRLSENLMDGDPEVLTLREGANPASLAAEEDGADNDDGSKGDEKDVEASEKADTSSSKKKRKSTSSSKTNKATKNGSKTKTAKTTFSDFDRKLRTLSRFEKCLSEDSLKSVLAWQSEPLKQRRVTCALCAKLVSGSYHDLMEHVWKDHGPPTVDAKDVKSSDAGSSLNVCSHCSTVCSTRSELTSHLKTAHKGAGIDCKFCGKNTSNLRSLKTHETSCEKNPNAGLNPPENPKTRLSCQQCGKSFYNQTSLKAHVDLVHGQTTSTSSDAPSMPPTALPKKPSLQFCVTCQKSFSTKTVLDSHIRMVHLGEKEVPKPCPDCGKNYTMRAMREHRKRDHQGLRYQCPDCPTARLFTTKIMLTRHREVVHQKRRFRCTLCLAEFVDRCAWKLHHEAEHVGKRYPCPQCNKQFKRPGDVRRHIREVHQRCRYVCQYCEKSFSQQAKLKLHVRSLHMGNYPHICNLCGKGFLRPSTLKGHVNKEHGLQNILSTDELVLIKQSLELPQT